MAYSIRNHVLYRGMFPVRRVDVRYTGGTLDTSIAKCLVMHYTRGASAMSSVNWWNDPKNTFKSSAHVAIDRDGSIIQCVKFDTVANHAGKSRWRDANGTSLQSFNSFALSIELANWGPLWRTEGGWTDGQSNLIPRPILAAHRLGNPAGFRPQELIGWEPYPPEQFDTAVSAARAMVATYGITDIVGHDDISGFRGKRDPGPAFDMARFRELVLGDLGDDVQAPRMAVAPEEGLNLRRGPGLTFEVVQLMPRGTVVEPLDREGNWMCVSVLTEAGQPTLTGWVNGRYLEDVA